MDNILLFFVLPISTILLSIVLQKVLKTPILVSITFFAIYLILTYTVFESEFLIFGVIYTIISYITAVLTKYIGNLIERINISNRIRCENRRFSLEENLPLNQQEFNLQNQDFNTSFFRGNCSGRRR